MALWLAIVAAGWCMWDRVRYSDVCVTANGGTAATVWLRHVFFKRRQDPVWTPGAKASRDPFTVLNYDYMHFLSVGHLSLNYFSIKHYYVWPQSGFLVGTFKCVKPRIN